MGILDEIANGGRRHWPGYIRPRNGNHKRPYHYQRQLLSTLGKRRDDLESYSYQRDINNQSEGKEDFRDQNGVEIPNFATLSGEVLAAYHPAHYDFYATPDDEKSLLPIYFKSKDTWYPTTAFIDPFGRYPVLMPTKFQREEEESVEEARGYLSYFTRGTADRTIEGVKIGTDRGSDDMEFLRSGRTLINLYELTQLEDSLTSDLTLLEIPYSLLSSDQLSTLVKQMQTTIKNPDINLDSLELKKKEMREILKVHSLNMTTWSDGVLIATEMPETYERDEDSREVMEDKAAKIRERLGNAYSVPIIVDRATAQQYWETQPLLYQAPQRVSKRNIQELTFAESDNKRVQKDLHPTVFLEDSLQQMTDVFLESSRTQDSNERNRLMAAHAEIAETAQATLADHFKTVTQQMVVAKEEIELLTKAHAVQKTKIKNISEEQMETEERFKTESEKLNITLDNLRSKIAEDAEDKEALQLKLQEMEEQFTKDKQAHAEEIEDFKTKILNLNETKLDLERQIDDKTANANNLSDKSFSITEAQEKLTGSTKKQRQRMVRPLGSSSRLENNQSSPKVKQKAPIRRNLMTNFTMVDSDDTDGEEPSQFMSPKRPSSSAAINALMLQPSKSGLTKFNPAEGTIIDWFAHNRTQVSYIRSLGLTDEQVVRLLLMNLPANLSWIASNLTEDELGNVDKAAAKVIKLVMGSTTPLHNFLAVQKGALEHPLAFLDRLRNLAEVAGHKTNDPLVLKLFLEKLESNLDPATSLELKRSLSKPPTNISDITAALNTAIKLTSSTSLMTPHNNALVTMMEQFSVNAMGKRQASKSDKCFNCGKTGHWASDCWAGRESKDSKDGSRRKGRRRRKKKSKTNAEGN